MIEGERKPGKSAKSSKKQENLEEFQEANISLYSRLLQNVAIGQKNKMLCTGAKVAGREML